MKPFHPSFEMEVLQDAHMNYLLLPVQEKRDAFIAFLKRHGIGAVSHQVQLHDSSMGRVYACTRGDMIHTVKDANPLVRLPPWLGLERHMAEVAKEIRLALDEG